MKPWTARRVEIGRWLFGINWNPEHATQTELDDIDVSERECDTEEHEQENTMKKKIVNVLVCRVGRLPVVEELPPNGDRHGGHLDAMQKIVGGSVQVITLDDGVELWCNEDGNALGLPLNRVIAAAPRPEPTLFGEPVAVIYAGEDLARPGEPGVWRIEGDFFLALSDDDGEVVSLSDEMVKKYSTLFDSEDVEAAKRMNALRVKNEARSWR